MNEKQYLKVRADFWPDGRLVPIMFRAEEGERVIIDRVLDIRPAPALKAGGHGTRYTCRAGNNIFFLFCDRGRWFFEEADASLPLPPPR